MCGEVHERCCPKVSGASCAVEESLVAYDGAQEEG